MKGYAAPETKLAAERARLLIEQAEERGEPPEDPLLLFSVLYGIWAANFVASNGDVCRELAAHFLALAQKQEATIPIVSWAFLYYGRATSRTGKRTSIGRWPFTILPSKGSVWPGRAGDNLYVPVVGQLDTRLSRGRSYGR